MIKNLVKKLIPSTILEKRRRKISAENQQKFADKSVAETFSEFTRKTRGAASRENFIRATVRARNMPKFTRKRFADSSRKIKSIACRFGLRRFSRRVKIVSDAFHYTGCDVVFSLVKHLNETYKSETSNFDV
jgi:hypothetical protein